MLEKLRVDLTPKDVTVLPVGGLIASWDTGLVGSWGIGFNHDETDLWVGNITLAGGDDLDYRFLPDGTLTGDTIDTTIFRSVFAADMAYNPFTRTLWQVNVGSDNCVYELDPAAMAATGRKICPPFGTSERGLAFDPLTNTYYAGSWNDGIVNHFKEDGTLIDSAAVNLSISGLAFNPATGHLFALTNHAVEQGLFDVYVLDVRQFLQHRRRLQPHRRLDACLLELQPGRAGARLRREISGRSTRAWIRSMSLKPARPASATGRPAG